MHKNIKRFELVGIIRDDSDFIRLRNEHVGNVTMMMRDYGYVPRFDIEECWSTNWNGSAYDFRLSIYGVYVGKKRAQCLAGYDGIRPVAYTQTPKLGMLSEQPV